MRIHLRCAAFLLATVLVARVCAQNATEPIVSIDSGPIVQVCASCSPRELRLAVTAKPGLRIKKSKTEQEDPEVIEVSFGNVRDASLVSEFVPRWDLSKCGIPRAL